MCCHHRRGTTTVGVNSRPELRWRTEYRRAPLLCCHQQHHFSRIRCCGPRSPSGVCVPTPEIAPATIVLPEGSTGASRFLKKCGREEPLIPESVKIKSDSESVNVVTEGSLAEAAIVGYTRPTLTICP